MAQNSGLIRVVILHNQLNLDPEKWTHIISKFMDIAEITDITKIPAQKVFEKLKKHASNSNEEENLLQMLNFLAGNSNSRIALVRDNLKELLSSVSSKAESLCELAAKVSKELQTLRNVCGNEEQFASAVKSFAISNVSESRIKELFTRLHHQFLELEDFGICFVEENSFSLSSAEQHSGFQNPCSSFAEAPTTTSSVFRVPIIWQIIKFFTFLDFQYSDEKHSDEIITSLTENITKLLFCMSSGVENLGELANNINEELQSLQKVCGNEDHFRSAIRSVTLPNDFESRIKVLYRRLHSQFLELGGFGIHLVEANLFDLPMHHSNFQNPSLCSAEALAAKSESSGVSKCFGAVKADLGAEKIIKKDGQQNSSQTNDYRFAVSKSENAENEGTLVLEKQREVELKGVDKLSPEEDHVTKMIEITNRLRINSTQIFFPCGVGFSDSVRVLAIGDPARNKWKENSIENLAWRVFRGIMSYNGAARETNIQNQDSLASGKRQYGQYSESDDNSDEENPDIFNPMDVLQICFLCCDPEVKQILCRALFSCKLAFPLLYNDSNGHLTLSKWALRDILVEYRDKEDKHVETTLVSDHRFPIVCFARVGDLAFSKSKLLNTMLGNSSHATFFHRGRVNGHVKRRCTNGMIEAALFLPSGRKAVDQSEKFSQAVLLANMRGNLMDFMSEQKLALSNIGDVVVLFGAVDSLLQSEVKNFLEALKSSNKILVVLCMSSRLVETQSESRNEELKSLLCKIPHVRTYSRGNREKNETRLQDEIFECLSNLLGQVEGKKLEELPQLSDIPSDERDEVHETQIAAKNVMRHLHKSDGRAFKANHLRLQGIWMQFSQLHKTENSSKAFKEDLVKLQLEKKQKREAQIEICKNPSQFLIEMIGFLKNGLSKKDNGLSAKLFLQWVKLMFDEISRQTLPGLLNRRNQLRDDLQKSSQNSGTMFKDKGDLEYYKKALISKLENAEKEICDSSVGLENVFREIGQVFEASSELKHTIPFVTDSVPLPVLFARLLMWGIPMEILDGDASNIPLTWVSSVLTQCQLIAGDKKIFAISVLGLQSSGKSTLLNTMFGLKFAVSAGRCTRGAFLQLVPVESGMPFDYIAVIDTEGLRAPELGLQKHHHDNELATLVIGLGDLTIINIKGENSAEMKDILQIAVHAFIRMKIANRKVDLRRKCIFVHQNVPAVAAKEKMKDANYKMQQELDQITREAAEGEKQTNIHSFCDIISFDSNKDIFYMSDLWNGDPPLAPINLGYAQRVQEIKRYILDCSTIQMKNFQGFQDFATRIKDLWKAIMSEDFVFSFRNSIEMKAYSQLEKCFFEIKCKVDEQLNDWLMTKAGIQIRKCTTAEELMKEQQNQVDGLRIFTDSCYDTSTQELLDFFENNPHSELTIQWRSKKLNSLKEHVDTLLSDIGQKLRNLSEVRMLEIQQDSLKVSWERDILREAKKMATSEKLSNVSDGYIDECFENLWQKFTYSLPAETQHSGHSVKRQIEKFVRECYKSHREVVNHYLENIPFLEDKCSIGMKLTAEQLFWSDDRELIELKKSSGEKIKGLFSTDAIQKKLTSAKDALLKASNQVFESLNIDLADMQKQSRWFKDSDAIRVQRNVTESLKSKGSEFQSFRTTQTFEIKLVVLALARAYPVFFEFDRKFHESCSIKARTQQMKEKIKNAFTNMVKKQSDSKLAADYVRDHMKKVVKDAINERLGAKLMTPVITEIGNGKFHLILRMLDGWARERDFESIIQYVGNPETAALSWLTNFIPNFLADKTAESDQECRSFNIISVQLIEPIFNAIHSAATKSNQQSNSSIKAWISFFCDHVGQTGQSGLAVLPADLANGLMGMGFVLDENKISLSDFIEFFQKGMELVKQSLLTEYRSVNPKTADFVVIGNTLNNTISQKLWGCKAHCPFCYEPCSKDDQNHFEKEHTAHACIQHRPQGVSGMRERKTKELAFETCEFKITSTWAFCCGICKANGRTSENCAKAGKKDAVYHPFKEYKKIFPDWDIKPDATNYDNKFWMWFCWTFREQLRDHHKCGIKNMPRSWADVDEEEALKSLRETFLK